MRRSEKIHLFVEEIWAWFARHKRTLPWRDLKIADDTQRVYMVLVSEIMLQQTQVSRVETAFPRFLRQFPTLPDLARTSNRDVIIAWKGMGYNSRALRLRDAARTVLEQFDGVFPSDFEQLRSINGIGHYTAGAIRNFAFGIPTPCIDTNIRRILHRVFVGPENADGTWKKKDTELLAIAEEVLDAALVQSSNQQPANQQPRTTADWHAALMDFGSLVCRKSGVRVEICPLAKKNLYAGGPVITAPRIKKLAKQEPGRFVGATFVPNRIFRGRIVEELRHAADPLSLPQIGRKITVDWSPELREWLHELLVALERDGLICRIQSSYLLA